MLGIPPPTVPLPAGLRIEERWEVGVPLRPGGCNSYLACDLQTGAEVVVKLLAAMPFPVDLDRVEAAVAALRAVEAVYVPRILALSQGRVGGKHAVFLVHERLRGVSIADLVTREGPLPEERVRGIARHLLEALRVTGRQTPPLVHGDLSPENVLVREAPGGVALVDWAGPKAAARDWSSQEFGPSGWSLAASRDFSAPEVSMGSPNPRSDLYGAGACAAFALTARAPDPLRSLDPRRVLNHALLSSGVSEPLAKLLARLLDPTSEKRLPSAQEALEALRDPAALARVRAQASSLGPAPAWQLVPDSATGPRWAALAVLLATVPALPFMAATVATLVPIGFGMRGMAVLARIGAGLILAEIAWLTLRAGVRGVAGLGRARIEAYGRGLRVDCGPGWRDIPWIQLTAVRRRGPLLVIDGAWADPPGGPARRRRLLLAPVYPLGLDELAQRLREGMARAAALAPRAGRSPRPHAGRAGLPAGMLAVSGLLLLGVALVGDRWGAWEPAPDHGRIRPSAAVREPSLRAASGAYRAKEGEDSARAGLAVLASERPARTPDPAEGAGPGAKNPLDHVMDRARGAQARGRSARAAERFAMALAEVRGGSSVPSSRPARAGAPLRLEEALRPLEDEPVEVRPSPAVPASANACPAGMAPRDLAPGLIPAACWGPHGTMVWVPAEGSAPAFLLDWTEVTTSDYAACVAEGVCTLAGEGVGCHGRDTAAGSVPVNCVDQAQAAAWCVWAGRRLCTASEHQRAATGPGGAIYPWGDAPADCAHAVRDGRGTPGASDAPGCGRGGPWPVGSRPSGVSPVGALDLSGNLAEWVARGGVAGGSYMDKAPEELQAGGLRPIPPEFALPDVGFRCCREDAL